MLTRLAAVRRTTVLRTAAKRKPTRWRHSALAAQRLDQPVEVFLIVEKVHRHPQAADARGVALGDPDAPIKQLLQARRITRRSLAEREGDDARPRRRLQWTDDRDPGRAEAVDQQLGQPEDVLLDGHDAQ